LPAVGACVTLLAPTPDRVATTLRAVDEFEGENKWRHDIAAVVETLVPPDSEAGTVAVRPDPVGERLVLQKLGAQREFLGRCLDAANDEERLNACVTISRAAERDEPAAAALAEAVLAHQPQMWQPALSVVAAQGGPFGAPLLTLADRDDSPLPLAQLAETIPLGHVTLRDLALVATQRTRPSDPANSTDLDAHARVSRVVEQPLQSAGRHRGSGRGAGLDHRGRRALPAPRRGQPGRVPARPRHVTEQPRGAARRGWGATARARRLRRCLGRSPTRTPGRAGGGALPLERQPRRPRGRGPRPPHGRSVGAAGERTGPGGPIPSRGP
ncbi:MAG: hypothetical protein ACRDT0_09085, partial [Pseudonocardiaceae bacterium]